MKKNKKFYLLNCLLTLVVLITVGCTSPSKKSDSNPIITQQLNKISKKVNNYLTQLINNQPDKHREKLRLALQNISNYISQDLQWQKAINDSRSNKPKLSLNKLNLDYMQQLVGLDAIDILYLGEHPHLIKNYKQSTIVTEVLTNSESWSCKDISDFAQIWIKPGFCSFSINCRDLEEDYFDLYWKSRFQFGELFCTSDHQECQTNKSWRSLFEIHNRSVTERIYLASVDTYPGKLISRVK